MTRTISHYLQCTASLFSISFGLEVDSAFEKRNFDNCDTILVLMFNCLTVFLGGGGGGLSGWTSVPEERQL